MQLVVVKIYILMAAITNTVERSLSRSPPQSRERTRPPTAPHSEPAPAVVQPPSPPVVEVSLQENIISSVELQQTASIAASEPPPRDYRSIERDADGLVNAGPDYMRRKKHICKRVKYQRATCIEHVGFFCALSVSAYFGILARIYLTELAAWNGLPLFPAFYSEVVGTAIMGFVLSHKQLLETNHKFTYQALATGLCGSLTTFSSWNNDAATVLIQYGEEDPDNITRVIGWITVLLVGFGMPIVALKFGEHVGYLSPWADKRTGEKVYEMPKKATRMFEITSYIIFWGIATSVVVTIPLLLFNRHDFMFSFVLASLGAYIRWHLSPLNSTFQHFKLGTFLVNVLGTWILGIAYILDHHHEDEVGIEVKGLLYGATAGFCGCLTTVSTFAVELTTLSFPAAYLYGLSSVLAAQVGLIAIRGTYWWTK